MLGRAGGRGRQRPITRTANPVHTSFSYTFLPTLTGLTFVLSSHLPSTHNLRHISLNPHAAWDPAPSCFIVRGPALVLPVCTYYLSAPTAMSAGGECTLVHLPS